MMEEQLKTLFIEKLFHNEMLSSVQNKKYIQNLTNDYNSEKLNEKN